VALDLNDHLLQAVDGLLAALLGELLLHVVVGAVLGIAGTLLSLLGNVLTSLLLETVGTLLETLGGIDTRVGTLLLVAASKVSDISGVTGATGVGSLSGITESTLGLISVKGLLLYLDLAWFLRLSFDRSGTSCQVLSSAGLSIWLSSSSEGLTLLAAFWAASPAMSLKRMLASLTGNLLAMNEAGSRACTYRACGIDRWKG
jgi:hypothetical protein